MRNCKRFSLFALLFFFGIALHSETVEKMPAPTGYIDDYAHVFSDSAKSDMEDLCKEVHDKTKGQIFVVTISTLEGASIEEFSSQLFHNWKIGEKKTDRGILLLFAIKEHKYRYEIGPGFQGILNDAKVGDFGRSMVPDLRAGNYDDAARLGLRSVAQVVADDAKIELTTLQTAHDTDTTSTPETDQEALSDERAAIAAQESIPVSKWQIILPFGVFFGMSGLVAFFIFRGYQQHLHGTGSGFFSSSGGSDSSSSSSDDSSSSSDDFGGGDGGDSDGGGASGSW